MKRFVLFTALLVAVGCSQTGPQGDAGKGTPSPAPNPRNSRRNSAHRPAPRPGSRGRETGLAPDFAIKPR